MNWNEVLAVVQVLTSVAIVCTFLVYLGQLFAMRKQLAVAQSSSRNQNLLTLIAFLQNPDLVRARGVLFQLLDDSKPLSEWTTEERWQAERVCASYDVTGIVLREGDAVSNDAIAGNWRYSIQRAHAATADMMDLYQANRGADFWANFDWLARETGCPCRRCSPTPE